MTEPIETSESAPTREPYIYDGDSMRSVVNAVIKTLNRAITSGMADEHPIRFAFMVLDKEANEQFYTIHCSSSEAEAFENALEDYPDYLPEDDEKQPTEPEDPGNENDIQ